MMRLDIRIPLGLIFLIVGALLAAYGTATYGGAMYAPSMGIDLNLYWGLAMLLFGGSMLVLAWKRRRGTSYKHDTDEHLR